MSQKVVFMRLDGGNVTVRSSEPDYDDALEFCKEFDLTDMPGLFLGLEVDWDWYEIGEGESGTDSFFDDELLIYLYESGDFEEKIRELGQEVELVDYGCILVRPSDLDDDYNEEDDEYADGGC